MTMVAYLNSQFSVLQNIDFFIRLAVACICGAAIGFERSRRFKGAGLRTHIIVCFGAALMMIVSKYSFADLTSPAGINFNGVRGADSARVAAQVVSGISFLGAGVIFKHGSSIRGLTTAAGVWATAGIGLAVGAGMYPLGIFSTILIFGVQYLMHWHTFAGENMITSKIRFTVAQDGRFQESWDDFLEERHAQVLESRITYSVNCEMTYELVVRAPTDITMKEVNAFLRSTADVRSVDMSLV